MILTRAAYNSRAVAVDTAYYRKVGDLVPQRYRERVRGAGAVVGFAGAFVDLHQTKNLLGIFVMAIVAHFLTDIQEDDQRRTQPHGEAQQMNNRKHAAIGQLAKNCFEGML